MDEAIAALVTVTGTTPELAAQYVQLADGDPNQAVQLFFENGGADLAANTSQPQTTATSRNTGALEDPIELDDDANISDDNDPEITGFRKTTDNTQSRTPAASHFEDDEAMARRLQEEMYGAGGGEDQPLRAPIARQAETLVGPGADALPMVGDYNAAVEERMRQFERRRNQGECLPCLPNKTYN
jgi:hypothetical protein